MADLSISLEKKRFCVCDSLYGLFFEDINRSGDGGLYPELIRNRAFEDSLYPEDLIPKGDDLANTEGWLFEYQKGEGQKRWKECVAPTKIPAWYGEGAEFSLDREDTLNEYRQAALSVRFEEGGSIWNVGYSGVPVWAGEAYHMYFFAKADREIPLEICIEGKEGTFCSRRISICTKGYVRYDLTLVPGRTSKEARVCMTAPEGGSLKVGFISLMPTDTYCGHGLRRDLCEKLEALRPGFLRFPGGCIVEGFSKSTAQRFKRMAGPVWERPGVLNLWGYRSTEGLGFHEYLQLCEDLKTDAMYVCNCGMTCQVRGSILMEEDEIQELLDDVFCALEYAMGGRETVWGSLRARMGHPEPFGLKYLEIGNENNGSDYEERYERFRKAVSEKYPELIIVANTHVEEAGLPLHIADEHFYNKTEWFAMNTHQYDHYDRRGPGIFVGEFAVVAGDIRTLYTAVGEAMFMVGMERNQDIVKLAAYAPLFENVHYAAWEPNLIAFDGLDHYGIPSYYVWRLFGNNRGKTVVESTLSCDRVYAPYLRGGPCLCGSQGVRFKNALWRGEPVAASQEIFGAVQSLGDGSFTTQILPDSGQAENARRFGMEGSVLIVLGEDQTSREGRFEIELMADPEKELGIGMFAIPYGKGRNSEDSPWNLFSVQPVRWKIQGTKSRLVADAGFREKDLTEPVEVAVESNAYHKFVMETDGRTLWCVLDGRKVMEAQLPHYDEMQAVVTEDEETVFVKLVNIAQEAKKVEICLDLDVCADYEADVISGDPADKNTLEEPEKVRERCVECSGAGRRFAYEAPATSVNVLRLKKGLKSDDN